MYKGFYVCTTCINHIGQGKIPPTSAANRVGFHHIPPKPELTGLTNLEARLVSARIPFMWIKMKPGSSGMKCIKGTMTCVPADVTTTVESLPRNVNEVDVVHVELKKNVDHKTVYAKENIRPAVVQRAAKCLQESELYQKEGISPCLLYTSPSPRD